MVPMYLEAAAGGGMESITTVTTFLWSEVGKVVETIVSTPLLLIPVGLFLAGGAIGLAKRFIHG